MNKPPIIPLLCAMVSLPIASAVAAPANAPKFAPTSATDCKRNDLLYHFDMIPGKEFAGFGGVNRRSLLKRKGAVVDYNRKYIMIPGSANPQDGSLRMVQISLFGSGDPLVAVSRVMWDNSSGKLSTLHFYYGYADGAPVLRTAAERAFPYELGDGNYADLPRNGTTIKEMDASGQSQMASYHFDNKEMRFYQNN